MQIYILEDINDGVSTFLTDWECLLSLSEIISDD